MIKTLKSVYTNHNLFSRNIKILLLLFFFILTLVLVVNVLSIFKFKQEREALTTHIESLYEIDEIQQKLRLLQFHRLQYTITGHQEHLDQIRELKKSFDVHIQRYNSLHSHDSVEVMMLKHLLTKSFEITDLTTNLKQQSVHNIDRQIELDKAFQLYDKELNELINNIRKTDYALLDFYKGALYNQSEDSIHINYVGVLITILILIVLFWTLLIVFKKIIALNNHLKLKSERMFIASQAANIGAWDWDLKEWTIKWSVNVHQVFGIDRTYKLETIDDVLTVVMPEDVTNLQNTIEKTLQTKSDYFFTNYRVKGEEDKIKMISARGKVYYDANNEPERFMGVVADITDKIKAEELAKEKELKFGELINILQEGLIYINLSGQIKYLNPEAKKIFNVTKEKQAVINELIPEEYLNLKSKKQLSKSNKSVQFEVKIKINETLKHLYISCSPFKNIFDIPAGAVIIISDITAMKHAEMQLQERNNELNTYIYRTYHDLKAPVDSLKSLIYLAQKQVPDESREIILHLEKASNKLSFILNDLIQTLNIKDKPLEPANLNVENLVSEIIELIKEKDNTKCESANINVHVEKKIISTDKKLITFILQHLINNALTYKDAHKEKHMVNVNVNSYNGGIHFSITDNGEGMEDEQVKNVFQMFYRGSMASNGNGLGLYMTKKCVEKLQGDIVVNSSKGKGTTVEFTIPPLGSIKNN